MNRSDSIENVSKAFVKAQIDIKNAIKDSKGFKGEYSSLAQVLDIIKSAIHPHDAAFIQLVGCMDSGGNRVSLENIFLHSSGEYISCVSENYIDEKMVTKTQGVGSAVTYLRRKAAVAFFGIGEEDTVDGVVEKLVKNGENPINKLEEIIQKSTEPKKTREFVLKQENVNKINDLSTIAVKKWIKILENKLKK